MAVKMEQAQVPFLRRPVSSPIGNEPKHLDQSTQTPCLLTRLKSFNSKNPIDDQTYFLELSFSDFTVLESFAHPRLNNQDASVKKEAFSKSRPDPLAIVKSEALSCEEQLSTVAQLPGSKFTEEISKETNLSSVLGSHKNLKISRMVRLNSNNSKVCHRAVSDRVNRDVSSRITRRKRPYSVQQNLICANLSQSNEQESQICNICEKRFPSNSLLLEHLLSHLFPVSQTGESVTSRLNVSSAANELSSEKEMKNVCLSGEDGFMVPRDVLFVEEISVVDKPNQKGLNGEHVDKMEVEIVNIAKCPTEMESFVKRELLNTTEVATEKDWIVDPQDVSREHDKLEEIVKEEMEIEIYESPRSPIDTSSRFTKSQDSSTEDCLVFEILENPVKGPEEQESFEEMEIKILGTPKLSTEAISTFTKTEDSNRGVGYSVLERSQNPTESLSLNESLREMETPEVLNETVPKFNHFGSEDSSFVKCDSLIDKLDDKSAESPVEIGSFESVKFLTEHLMTVKMVKFEDSDEKFHSGVEELEINRTESSLQLEIPTEKGQEDLPGVELCSPKHPELSEPEKESFDPGFDYLENNLGLNKDQGDDVPGTTRSETTKDQFELNGPQTTEAAIDHAMMELDIPSLSTNCQFEPKEEQPTPTQQISINANKTEPNINRHGLGEVEVVESPEHSVTMNKNVAEVLDENSSNEDCIYVVFEKVEDGRKLLKGSGELESPKSIECMVYRNDKVSLENQTKVVQQLKDDQTKFFLKECSKMKQLGVVHPISSVNTPNITEESQPRSSKSTKTKKSPILMLKVVPLKQQRKRPRYSYLCNACHLSFKTDTLLGKHHRSHVFPFPHLCKVCSFSYKKQKELKQHLLIHQNQLFLCKRCDRTFDLLFDLKNHVCIGADDKEPTPNEPEPSTPRMFFCNECSASFPFQSGLETHLLSHCNQHECTFCQKTFDRKYLLNTHLLTHTRMGRHRRKMMFSQEVILKTHLLNHMGEKPHRCTKCQQSFKTFTNLRSHSFTHLGIKPFSCPYCNKVFCWKNNFDKHLTSHAAGCKSQKELTGKRADSETK